MEMRRRFAQFAGVCVAVLALVGCSSLAGAGTLEDTMMIEASLSPPSAVQLRNADLPPPTEIIDVAVYGFEDRTGQSKPADGFSEFSKAVTQGADAFLIEALKGVGKGKWFRVVERANLENLLQERNIIEQMRKQYEGRGGRTLPALRFAGLLIEGGIVGYDTNQVSGGAGARFLSVGINQTYREDVITVSMRVVSVATGEVLSSQTTTKTAYSILRQGNVFQVITPINAGEILEFEAGYTRNEPVSLAVRQAIEFAVYSMVVEGARDGLWKFDDMAQGNAIINKYERRYLRLTSAQKAAFDLSNEKSEFGE